MSAELAARLVARQFVFAETIGEAIARAGVALTIDAEESERCPLQLDLFLRLAAQPALRGWPGLGIAVRAYRHALPQTLDALFAASRRRAPARARRHDLLPVRHA